MADTKMRVFKLRNQSQDDLKKGLEGLKSELSQLRVAKVTGGAASKIAKIKVVRKQIAKHLTVITEKVRTNLREELKGKRLPKQMRAKKTRSIRRRLTTQQLKMKTAKQQKKEENFKLRKFALRA